MCIRDSAHTHVHAHLRAWTDARTCTKAHMCGPTNGRKDRATDGRADRWTDGRMEGRTDGWTDG
eukprot:10463817-Alexandrium_andersonii.AAC.1